MLWLCFSLKTKEKEKGGDFTREGPFQRQGEHNEEAGVSFIFAAQRPSHLPRNVLTVNTLNWTRQSEKPIKSPAQEVGVTQCLCLSPCFARADAVEYACFVSPKLFPEEKSLFSSGKKPTYICMYMCAQPSRKMETWLCQLFIPFRLCVSQVPFGKQCYRHVDLEGVLGTFYYSDFWMIFLLGTNLFLQNKCYSEIDKKAVHCICPYSLPSFSASDPKGCSKA